jgi:Smr domain
MKYEPGDKILVLLTEEEGKVVEIINEQMVMIDVKGVKFPAYLDQIDFPYFKMFSEKRKAEKQKVFIDNVKPEKTISAVKKVANGVFLSFIPIFDKDIFDDDVVEKFKIHLINQTNEQYNFTYNLFIGGESDFELINTVLPLSDFYVHDVNFEHLSDNPRFHFDFSLTIPNKKKTDFYEASLKIKAKQLFKKIEGIQQKNEPSFSYLLFEEYPEKVMQEKLDITKLGDKGFRLYDISRVAQHLPPPRSVVDLHIEKLSDNWKHLSNFEILSMQLKEFEKFYDLAVSHYQPVLTVIHGVGTGKLRDEIHAILNTKKEVKSFINQYTASYGYGATEIYFTHL